MARLHAFRGEKRTDSEVFIIRPRRRGFTPHLSELWRFRELLYHLVLRDVKVRYKQTVFGAAWALLQPVLMMLVFALFLGRLGGVQTGQVPYPLFVLTGLIPWTLFAQALIGASASLVENEKLVTKIYFPRLFMPIAAASSFLLDFGIGFLLLVGVMFHYGVRPSPRLMFVPVFAAFTFVISVAVGVFLAAVNVRFRDVRYAVPFLTQLWLFATPIAYPSSLVPAGWRSIYALNPMTGAVEGFRWALLGTTPAPGRWVGVSVAATVASLLGGIAYFQRVERGFADII